MDRNVVLIADRVLDFDNITVSNRNLECIPPTYFNQIFEGLSKICPKVTHYDSPQDFCCNLGKHKNDIVLSIWSGIGSKFRKGLIPSICEVNDICYVGADPYVHVLCQDKFLTKIIASKFGLASAESILYYSEKDEKNIYNLKLPLVIKPNYEGGSNGISQKNLVYNYADAILLAQKLLCLFQQPILIEEYMEGVEICTSIIGSYDNLDLLEASQLIIGDVDYYTNVLYGFEAKVQEPENRRLVSGSTYLTPSLKKKFEEIFFNIGKTELLRIDGRIDKNGIFRLIELTPDAYLGRRGSTTFCAMQNGISYEEMLELILKNAVKGYTRRKEKQF